MKLSLITLTLLLAAASLCAEPLSNQELFQKANQAYNAKSYQEAYPLFEDLNEKEPESPEINFLVGRTTKRLPRLIGF